MQICCKYNVKILKTDKLGLFLQTKYDFCMNV